MSDPNFVILYVDTPPASAEFYGDLLGKIPVEASPTFALGDGFRPQLRRDRSRRKPPARLLRRRAVTDAQARSRAFSGS
jgi:hypothetical protein